MKSTYTQLLSGSLVWLVSGAALSLSTSAWGQTAPPDEAPALKIERPVKPAVTVQRQGRLLILSYRLVGADGEPYTQSVPSNQPEFTVYRGQRKIASGQFQYG